MDDQKGQQEENNTQSKGDHSDDQHESIELDSQGRPLTSSSSSQVSNLTHHSIGSDLDDNTTSSTFLAQSSEESNVFSF